MSIVMPHRARHVPCWLAETELDETTKQAFASLCLPETDSRSGRPKRFGLAEVRVKTTIYDINLAGDPVALDLSPSIRLITLMANGKRCM